MTTDPLYDRPRDLLSENYFSDDVPLPTGKSFVGRPSLAYVAGVKEYIETLLFALSSAENRRRTEERIAVGVFLLFI
jgi:hypothetical protein